MKLLLISGKKQSGKDTVAAFLRRNARTLLCPSRPVATVYFGTPMKDFATNYLGVERHKVWGTDAQKNEPTHIRWESIPNYMSLCDRWYKEALDAERPWSCPSGFMTGRQLLQYIGEDLFLKMDPDIWVRQFEQKVRESEYDVILSPDPRKPEQIECGRRLGGKSIRLLRDPYQGADRHISELALDSPAYDEANFDAVIDNRTLGIEETNRRVVDVLIRWGWVDCCVDLSKIQWS